MGISLLVTAHCLLLNAHWLLITDMSLQTGLDLLGQKRYAQAVQSLEAFLAGQSGTVREQLQARVALVQAYHRNGQVLEAIALCQKLAQSKNPTIQVWAEESLPKLQGASNSKKTTLKQLLHRGQQALKDKQYPQAIAALENYCSRVKDPDEPGYGQAQMGLVKAYQAVGQLEDAIALCQELTQTSDIMLESWAQQMLGALKSSQTKQNAPPDSDPPKQNKAVGGVRVPIAGTKDSLLLVSGITLTLLLGFVFVFLLLISQVVLYGNDWPLTLPAALGLTIGFNLLIFVFSPPLMDWMQHSLYGVRWVSLPDLEKDSPEAAQTLQRICKKHKLTPPKLGIIGDQTPTAFTYGSFPNTARIIVSDGLFHYLSDEEVAAVYAHELGHIIHWDFAVMTVAATLVQMMYLIYIYLSEPENNQDSKAVLAGRLAMAAYIFYLIGTYLILYLSRIREYYADHFSAQNTGNPNALSRALVKIAYGILESNESQEKPNRLTEGTRSLGIYDPKAASTTGTAYRLNSETQNLNRVFLWDLFNPWAFWMELNSTHPLTGKRIRALSTYAEQLGLNREFDMATVVQDGKQLSKKKLYGNFALDILRYLSPWLGLGVGGILTLFTGNFSCLLLGLGGGILCYGFALFPRFQSWDNTEVFSLLSNPYASPLHPIPATLTGEIIGRGDAGYVFGSDLMFEDETGLMFIHYASFWGPLGNFFFGATQANQFIGQGGKVRGWFRRGITPYLDLHEMSLGGEVVKGYHDAWLLIVGVLLVVLGGVTLLLS
ncbi:M48 family metalloprotease [Spirulina sp. CS-785/01]|uniref:M48 family metalloprotease n=1 Tax=Spirulina sp. CS-785/01 TaxID=3021716 RepID=UPI00232F8CCF|nr:M48 family metalloprotease [Spirulina sp. CS-785/01]MDB9314193.1 M48 family metalloprotease [Spirulina sp. CS-785/01]